MHHSHSILKTLESVETRNIIYIMEQGLELEKAHYLATKNPQSRRRIADSCVLLSVLHFRQLNSDGTGSHTLDDVV